MTTAVAAAALGALSLIIAVLAGAKHLRRLRAAVSRVRTEDALKHLLGEEYRGRRASFTSLAGALRIPDRRVMQILGRMQERGFVRTRGAQFELTSEGERAAGQVVRAHRLLERYFADEARLPLADVHRAAERREHDLSPEQVDALDASLGYPRLDPHGDPIPTRDGRMAPASDVPATAWPTGRSGRISHLEDEPPLALSQIIAEGLRVGQTVRIVDASPERIVLSDGAREYRLAPAVAANVFLCPAEDAAAAHLIRLSELPHGAAADVVALDDGCQGFSRRRLMDLGFTPGARLESALETFARDPRAYRVRGTLVALRKEQARHVLVRPAPAAGGVRTEEAV